MAPVPNILYTLDGVTISTAEISIVSGTTSLQTITTAVFAQLWVDAATMVKGDEFRIRIYEKVEPTGGTKTVVFEAFLSDVQSTVWVSPGLLLLGGWDMTLLRTGGSDRAFDATIRRIS